MIDTRYDSTRRLKVKSRSPASCRLSATARCLSRHLRMKALRRASISSRRRVDHVIVIGGDLLVQALSCMRQEVAVLVDVMPMSA